MYKHALIQIYIRSVIGFKVLTNKYKLNHIKFPDIHSEDYFLMLNILGIMFGKLYVLFCAINI